MLFSTDLIEMRRDLNQGWTQRHVYTSTVSVLIQFLMGKYSGLQSTLIKTKTEILLPTT